MSEHRYKPGDRVRIIRVMTCQEALGQLGTVIGESFSGRHIATNTIVHGVYAVEIDGIGNGGEVPYAFPASYLEPYYDGNETTSWSEVEKLTGWKPQQVKA